MYTVVTVNNPMCGNVYKFSCSKSEFMERFNNQVAGCGYFIGETMGELTIIINPGKCSFIEIYEESH